ncbi:hypothetical protein [Actinacidiphila acididurans]|uniref:Uncharacterized protein n=1 Tax=Actinacidiphila acididurans TaxID=2784346 RepID=A0ABS2U5D0_9ACTN|nr:hypothetical protein [Actinacidiphila acididurans]MBM9510376.1 hypothetical protein [Actinacidiphila acididurans]
MAVFLTVICELLIAVVVLFAHLGVWVWLLSAVLLPVVPATAAVMAGRRPGAMPPDLAASLPMAPVERLEQRVTHVVLPSSWPDYDFRFSATVRWSPTGALDSEPIVNAAGMAVEAVLDRARRITEQREPTRASLVQHELNGALGRLQPDDTGSLQVMAEAVVLALAEADQQRLDKLATVRKDKAVWEHERTYEQSRREYLGQDVLKDPGSAVVWWLARNEDHVEKTVGDIGLLAQLSSAANNADVPEQFRHFVDQPPLGVNRWAGAWQAAPSVAPEPDEDAAEPAEEGPEKSAADHYGDFLRAMFPDRDDARIPLLTRRVAEAVAANDMRDTADELLRRFEVTAPKEDDEGAAPDTGDGPEWPDVEDPAGGCRQPLKPGSSGSVDGRSMEDVPLVKRLLSQWSSCAKAVERRLGGD